MGVNLISTLKIQVILNYDNYLGSKEMESSGASRKGDIEWLTALECR